MSDRWGDDAIFARAGDFVTAEDGTIVAIVKRDLSRYALTSVDDFDWQIDKPLKHTKLDDTPGFRTSEDHRPQVCIEGEWRPAREEKN